MRHGRLAATLLLWLAGAAAAAAAETATLATRDQGMAWRDKLQNLIAEAGMDDAIATLRDEESRFAEADPALVIHRVTEDDRVIAEAHTLFQKVAGIDMTDQRDLEGRRFIRNFLEVVRQGGGVRPTTNAIPQADGEVHYAACYNEWAQGYKGDYFITVCYDHPERE